MNKDITVEWLKDNGFYEYTKSWLDPESVDHVYQKMYKDGVGKKYFIDVRHYKIYHPTTFEDLSGYEVSTQLYLKDSRNAVNLDFIDSDVTEAEKLIEKLFEIGVVEHYEKWN